MLYNIKCQVSGGVTGHRTSLLKSNGVVRFFENIADAQAEAYRLNKEMNNLYATASFSYTVILANDEPNAMEGLWQKMAF